VSAKYLPHFPKPVLDDLVTGKWVPVVGAGMSLNATVPTGKKMPLWAGMSKELSDELGDFASTSVLDGISAYEHEFGRARLIERLSDILLIREAHPGNAHKEFCTIPFDIVCTTNFDFLLERQYDLTPRYVYPVVDEEQLSINAGNAGTLLLKLHGDLRHPGRLIVTEADYDGFLTNYPLLATYLSNQLITKTAVFIGYSLDDPDFRQIWHIVSERLGRTRRMAYTIAVSARATDIARFERRGVKVINLPGSRDKYGEVLAATFKELREYMRDNVIAVSKVTEEQPLRELLLPRDATTRLCFFSLPLELLPFYRERVFPVVEEAGFVPVTADDVVTPGDNITAKLDALIDRASVMVAELTSSWTMAEYRMAIARIKGTGADLTQRKPLRLIVVVSDREQAPPSAQGFPVLSRPNTITDDPEGFIAELGELLRGIAVQTGVERQAEPQRLFDAREYRAAVISAMTLLEAKLRDRLNKIPWPQTRRPLSMRSLIDQAVEQGIVPQELRIHLDSWMRIRNEVVHSSISIPRAQASEIVHGVLELTTQLEI
jgi:SIR2-like protein